MKSRSPLDHRSAQPERGASGSRRRFWIVLAMGIPCAAWIATAVPHVLFIWSVLGKVDARHAFWDEVAEYVMISCSFSVPGTIVVVPIAIWMVRRQHILAVIVLGAASVLVYACANFLAIVLYSLRIT